MKHFKLLVTFFVFTIAVSCGQQKKYLSYTVKKGETMRSIAKKLDVKTKDLMRLNPDVSRKPKAATQIVIPNTKFVGRLEQDTTEAVEVVDEDVSEEVTVATEGAVEDLKKEFVLHTVGKGDTFYSLTRYYNVLKSDVLALNEELTEGLKLGATIKIKRLVEGEDQAIIYRDSIAPDAAVKVALLLPFRAKVFDTIAPRDIFKNDRLSNIVTDFYLGAALAVDSLRTQGAQVELTVIDTEDRNTVVNELIETNALDDQDVVIGSIYSDETKKLASHVKTPLVFPVFSKSQTSFRGASIVKTAPDKHLYKEKLLSYVSKQYRNENIIIVGDSTATSITQINQIATILKQHDSIDEVHQIIPHYGYIAQERFLKLMQPDTTAIKNWVIVATNNEVIAADAINSLISFPDPPEPENEEDEPEEKVNYLVKLFGFEPIASVDNNKLAQLDFVFATDAYVDEASLGARTFNTQYLRKNNALPSYYATRGFDITYDVLMRLASGKDLFETFKEGVSYRVESKFEFTKRRASLSQNNGLYLLEYQSDLSMKRID